MANKKKVFDRLDNINLPNSSKQEIFNLIEDVENDLDSGNLTVEGIMMVKGNIVPTFQVSCNKLKIPSHLISANSSNEVTLQLTSLICSTDYNRYPDIFLGTGLQEFKGTSRGGIEIDSKMLIGTDPLCIYQLDLPDEYIVDKSNYGYKISFPSGGGNGGSGELKISTDGGERAQIRTSTLMLSSGLGADTGNKTIFIQINPNANEFWFEKKSGIHDCYLRLATAIKNTSAGSSIYSFNGGEYTQIDNIGIPGIGIKQIVGKNKLHLINISTHVGGGEITMSTDILWLGSGLTTDASSGSIYLNVSTYFHFADITGGSDRVLTVSESVKNSLDKINTIGVDNFITKDNFDELLSQKLKELGITN